MELAVEAHDKDVMEEVIRYALVHDIEEVYTGDIPSTFKRQLRAQCPEVSSLLDGANHCPDEVKAIVKLADYLEAIHYIREFGGSRLAESVQADILGNFVQACQTSKANPRVVAKALDMSSKI